MKIEGEVQASYLANQGARVAEYLGSEEIMNSFLRRV